MRKILQTVAVLFIFVAMMFCLSGCGASPLAKAYNDLTNLATQGVQNEDSAYSDVIDNPLQMKYNEEKDALTLRFDSTADLDKIFEVLYKDLNGKDIGTIIFQMDGTRGDGFENDLNKKMGDLDCKSVGMLGVNYLVTDSDLEDHSWTKLAEKSEGLYITNKYGLNDVEAYSEEEQGRFNNIKHIELLYDGTQYFDSYSMLTNLESISFVSEDLYEIIEVEEDETSVVEEAVIEDETEAAEGETSDGNTTEEEASQAIDFGYNVYNSSVSNLLNFGEMKNLKTLLIYPDSGYNLTDSGERFIVSLQYFLPDLQVNKPNEVYAEGATVAVTEIETPYFGDEARLDVLGDLIETGVTDLYEKCSAFQKGTGEAKLNGKVVVYLDTPVESNWKSERAVSGSGSCMIVDTKTAGIAVPELIDDYQTFVLLYPVYTRTGSYTSGTVAYTKTLYAQVFDLTNEIAYEAVKVDSAAAPQSFSYYAGSAPEKKSGETDTSKAFEYLKKLTTSAEA